MMRIKPDGVLLCFGAHVMMMVEGPVIGRMPVSSVERKPEKKNGDASGPCYAKSPDAKA
jgi:hypothetical protein